jgi:malate synthase
MYEQYKVEELGKIKQEIGVQAFEGGRFDEAVELFDRLILNDDFAEFLTIPGYELI